MIAVFADTSFYVAFGNRGDQHYSRAMQIAATITGPIVTTEFVLVETANFCLEGSRRSAFLGLVADLRSAQDTEVLPASSEWFQRGLDLFAARPDKLWSLTDCISFAVMRDRRLTDALTADHNFEQAGFRALLR
jgi:predicted nucleic acid-binding protein